MKKSILMVVVTVFLFFSIVSSANAWWFDGNLSKVKRLSNQVYLTVDSGTKEMTVVCSETNINHILAVALTALTSGNDVSIEVLGGEIVSIVIKGN